MYSEMINFFFQIAPCVGTAERADVARERRIRMHKMCVFYV